MNGNNINCSHIEDKSGVTMHAIDIGGGRVVFLCGMCWKAVRSDVFDSIIKTFTETIVKETVKSKRGIFPQV